MLIINIAVLAATAYSSVGLPDIVYKYTSAFKTAGHHPDPPRHSYPICYHGRFNIWRAENYQSEFCSLGDILTEGTRHDTRTIHAVMVSAKKYKAVANPTSFTKVGFIPISEAFHQKHHHTTLNSYFYRSCALYKMNAPDGYTCLGGVAINQVTDDPEGYINKNNYCCVKNDYIVPGESVLAFNGLYNHVNFNMWFVERGYDQYGIEGGNFLPVSGDSVPSTGYLLKGDGVKVKDVMSIEKKVSPLVLNEVSDVKMIWEYQKSDVPFWYCAIWRAETPEGYYSLGDMVSNAMGKPPIAFVVSPSDPEDHDSLRPPVSYSQIGNGIGLVIWKARCPAGYVGLGNIATNGENPAFGSMYCVMQKYVLYDNSNITWSNPCYSTGKPFPTITLYEALASSNKQQTVRGFKAVANHHDYPTTFFMLNKDKLNYYTEPPIAKIYMYNVVYDLDTERQQSNPVKVNPTFIENLSNEKQTVWRTIGFSKTESRTFTFSNDIQIGVSLECHAGIPMIGGSKTTISAQTTFTHTTGSTSTNTTTDQVRASINLPPQSRSRAVITLEEYKADIPFTATIKKLFYDGTYSIGTISGIYKGISVSDARVVYHKIEKLGISSGGESSMFCTILRIFGLC